MSERLDLIHLEIGVSEVGVYCTTYLTPEAQVYREVNEEFQKLLDDINSAVAHAISKGAEDGTSTGTSYGPGAEMLAKKLNEQGLKVEVIEKPIAVDADAPVH